MARFYKEDVFGYAIPPQIAEGLHIQSIPYSDGGWIPENKQECLRTKLGANLFVMPDGTPFWFDMRMPGVEPTFTLKFKHISGVSSYWIANIGCSAEVGNPPWHGLRGEARLDAMGEFARENNIELPANWREPGHRVGWGYSLTTQFNVLSTTRFTHPFADYLYPILESCTDAGIRRLGKNIMALGAEKGLPPLVLESYLGLPQPARGSPEMKEYYKAREKLAANAARREEEEQSAEAVAAMKAGRKKSRRQKRRNTTRRR